MEKGSFHSSAVPVSSSVAEADRLVKSQPLPGQMPGLPDLSRFPAETLRSAALESLLAQNEDLMARLSVSLRRSNFLEDEASHLESEAATLRHRYETIKDQLLVMQEKDRLIAERTSQAQLESGNIRHQFVALEKKYADLYSEAQAYHRRLRRHLKYRHHMQRLSRSLKERLSRLDDLFKKERNRADHLEQELASSRTELHQVHTTQSETQMQLVNRYEAELAEARSQIDLLSKKSADRNHLFESKIKLENRLVFEERQARVYREETQSELEALKTERSDLTTQLKTHLIEFERMKTDLAQALEKLQEMEAQERQRCEQVESLQLLWKDRQTEVERMDEKNKALQKLNQQLSVSLNTQRKEIHELKTELEKQSYVSEQKISALTQALQNS